MKIPFECVTEEFKVRGYYDTLNEKKGLVWVDENGYDRGNSFPRNPYDRNLENEKFEKWRSFRDAILLNYHVILDTVKKFRNYDRVEINHWYYKLKVNYEA